jgi:prophage regulatory protein
MEEFHKNDRLLSPAEVRELTKLSATTIWREIRAGRFPAPVVLSPNRRAFRTADIDCWLQSRTAGRMLLSG